MKLPAQPLLLAAALSCGLASTGCSDAKTADDVETCAKTTGETVGSAAKTGGTTALAGLEQFGGAVGGLFEGGTDEAKKRWNEGKSKTKQTAQQGGEETRATGKQADCK